MPSAKFRRTVLRALAVLMLGSGAALAQGIAATPGAFDYYVLALSWSPEHCAGASGAGQSQCAARHGFVVHGLWPQYRAGGWPERCEPVRRVPHAVIERNLDVIPGEALIRHQWARHGTCTGLDPAGYFDLVRAAREAVKLPPDYRAPDAEITTDASLLRAAFAAANPGFMPQAFVAQCRGRRLAEVRVCFDRTLAPAPCGPDVVRDGCGGRAITVRPLS
jgi:ribonuclease T2